MTSEPSWKEYVAVALLDGMFAPLHLDEGWVILPRPKVELGENLLIPDLAGWRKERLSSEREADWISVVPDCVCEILSDDTIVLDKTRKMPIYARSGVSYLWLIDPQYKTLGLVSAYTLDSKSGLWAWQDVHLDGDRLKAAPFQETELDFGALFSDHHHELRASLW